MKSLREIINTSPLFVLSDASIDSVLKKMIKQKVSCALVITGSSGVVAGIVTERDVLRKISILDLEKKLDYRINTIMSPNVHFVHIDSLEADIKQLHEEEKKRHFPVLSKPGDNSVDNIAGLITVTDLCRYYLDEI
jgi:CBS domain-containing protein